MLSKKIESAFRDVKADQELKDTTLQYLQAQRTRRESYKLVRKYQYAMSFAVILMLIILGKSSFDALRNPVSYISMDVNPSMELVLNRFDKVVAVNAFNKEAEDIIGKVSVEGKSYVEAIDLIAEDPEMQRFIDVNQYVEFAVASTSEAKEQEILSRIETTAVYTSCRSACMGTDMDTVQQAHDNDISLGKYLMYQELAQYDDSVTLDDCRHKSMRELHDELSHHMNYENENEASTHHEEEPQNNCESQAESNSQTDCEPQEQTPQPQAQTNCETQGESKPQNNCEPQAETEHQIEQEHQVQKDYPVQQEVTPQEIVPQETAPQDTTTSESHGHRHQNGHE